jgi:hypothetical protein
MLNYINFLKHCFNAQKESEKKVEKGLEEKSKDDRKEGGMLCHCGTPAKREVVKKEGKNKGKQQIIHPSTFLITEEKKCLPSY